MVGGVILVWLIAAMLAALLAAASAIGIYQAVLAAELAAAGVLAVTWIVCRRGGAISSEDRVQLRRHRERRGF